MDIARDDIGWRQILVGYGLVLLIFAAMASALLATRLPQWSQPIEMAMGGVIMGVILLDMLLRPWAARLLARHPPSPEAAFRLKIGAVVVLCLLSLVCSACGALVTFAING